ncbi:M20/M25/M40 family metallo-hydrolase [Paenibacillus lautus]|uniref:M20/M25/M40 family metallo-hydrolase n=1 Tax=Paenibacillus lautus TaxID=1401 RepID=UPI002DBBA29C|nr:M20/M25/M40 family metallo-hydrolase [Paenibacillus lautus]MEC0307931.1 M20/M25/M40 family metallo-hydrolase [Paenibacillus lautus]
MTNHQNLKAITIISFIFLFAFISLYTMVPPSPDKKADISRNFSADRAVQHLNHIAKTAHPSGSVENEKVRNYLVEQLKLMGLKPEIEHSNHASLYPKMLTGGDMYNVIGKLEGTSSDHAMMMSAHYDSVQQGPGASDDGSGVAALLETIRVLKSGPPLKNDIYFVFTDGEEQGLMGAKEFWTKSNHKQKMDLIINFEARGTSGPSIMFQTSDQNGWMVKEFAKAAPNPVTSSLLGNLFEIMPNDSDLTVSNENKIPGLNFAYGDGWTGYHTPRDDVKHLDIRSLEHQGQNALTMARHFGQLELNDIKKENAVYFNFFGVVISYSYYWVYPLTGLILLLFAMVTIFAVKKKCATYKGLGISLLAILLAIISSIIATVLIWMGVNALWAEKITLFSGAIYDSLYYQWAFLLITASICFLIWRKFRTVNEWEMTLSAIFLGVIFLILLTQFLPGASYLFAWPLLVSLLILGWVVWKNKMDEIISNPWMLSLISFLPVVLFVPLLKLLFTFFPVSLVPYLMLLLVWLLALLFMQCKQLFGLGQWVPYTLLGIAVVILSISFFRANPSADRPIDSNLFYVVDQDKKQAQWITTQPPDDWTKKYIASTNTSNIKSILPFNYDKKAWVGNAPARNYQMPQIKLVKTETKQGNKIIHFRFTGGTDVQNMYLSIPGGRAQKIKVGEESFTIPKSMETFYYKQAGIPKQGLDVIVEVKGNQPVVFTFGSEQHPDPEIRSKRPPHLMTSGLFDESILVIKRVTY